ncbi:MAG: hypothetical protein HOP19_13990 [Acidobacteria bacterium]|nr:hypothetical protein [Acidobacteriota bacterium]
MKNTITNLLKTTMLGAAITIGVLAAQASAQDMFRRTVEIKFDFTAGTQQLPAGKYTIEPLNRTAGNKVFVVRNNQTNEQAIVAVTATNRMQTLENAALSFNRYGDQSFLSHINMGDNKYVVLRTKAEREAEKAYVARVKAQEHTSEIRY